MGHHLLGSSEGREVGEREAGSGHGVLTSERGCEVVPLLQAQSLGAPEDAALAPVQYIGGSPRSKTIHHA